ncbi:MAG: hypothetical protein H7308_09125 [Chthonomonadaceae bacterium]|nr:hypothetical protein [Chthonomonadaceae bacterium]
MFASAFAPHHDYIVVDGRLIPNLTREINARVHQGLFEGSRSGDLGNDLSKIKMRCEIINLRFLTSEIAVVHIAMKTESDNDTIATAVMQQQEGEWLIISYHNAHASHNPRTMDNPPA